MIKAVLYQNYLIEETVAKKMSHKKRSSPDIFMHILKRQIFIYWPIFMKFGGILTGYKRQLSVPKNHVVILSHVCCLGKCVWCHVFESDLRLVKKTSLLSIRFVEIVDTYWKLNEFQIE